jgi:ABC-type phosphate transport system substrate-binding protein
MPFPCRFFRPALLRRAFQVSTPGMLALLMSMALTMNAWAVNVVVNPGNPVTRLSRQELLAIFTMRQRNWPDGTPIVVLVQNPKSETHAKFCKDLLNLFPHQLQTIWDRLVYSGSGRAPVEFNTTQALIEKLAATPGGIGYMEPSDSDTKAKTIIVDIPSAAANAR